MMFIREMDAPDAAAIAFKPHNLVFGANRGGWKFGLECRDDLAVAIARIKEAAIDVRGLALRKNQLEEERCERHAREASRGDLGRELIGGQSPQFFGIVEQQSSREGCAELADREIRK